MSTHRSGPETDGEILREKNVRRQMQEALDQLPPPEHLLGVVGFEHLGDPKSGPRVVEPPIQPTPEPANDVRQRPRKMTVRDAILIEAAIQDKRDREARYHPSDARDQFDEVLMEMEGLILRLRQDINDRDAQRRLRELKQQHAPDAS